MSISQNRFAPVILLLCAALNCATAASGDLDKAFEALKDYRSEQNLAGLEPITLELRNANLDTAARAALEQRLAAVLASDAPVAAKRFVCRELSLIGTSRSIPMLAPLLQKPELSHLARFALERIPGEESAKALLQALSSARDEVQIGIINSLGAKRYDPATPALSQLLRDENNSVAVAAASALGRIGTSRAGDALAKADLHDPALGLPIAEASLMVAESLMRNGEKAQAAQIFERIYSASSASTLRFGAFRGLAVTASSNAAAQLLVNGLSSEDTQLRELSASIIAEGRILNKATLTKLMKQVPAQGQVTLLNALASAGDRSVVETVRAAIAAEVETVRVAAIRALAALGDNSDFEALFRLAKEGNPAERGAAVHALVNLSGEEVDSRLTSLLASSSDYRLLLPLITARHSPGSGKAIAAYMERGGEARLVALDALVNLGTEEQIPLLIPLLANPDTTTSVKANAVLRAIVGRTLGASMDELTTAYAAANPATRELLLEQFGIVAGPRALEIVRKALKDPENPVREAALMVLVEWPGAGATPDLLEIVRTTENRKWRTLALRGFVRLSRDGAMPAAERIKNLREAAKLAHTNDERLQVISALGSVRDPAAVRLLAGYLNEPALQQAASLALLNEAEALGSRHKELLLPLVRKVAEENAQQELKMRAAAIAKTLGGSL